MTARRDTDWLEDYAAKHAGNPRIASSLPAVSASRAATTSVGSAVKPAARATPAPSSYAPVTAVRHGDVLRLEIPGAALSANKIWVPQIVPTKKMVQITGPLHGLSAAQIIAGLYRFVLANFRATLIMSKDAKEWKARTTASLERHASLLPSAKTYSVTLEIHGRWLSLEGAVLQRDLDNTIKLIMDAVSHGLGFNDSRVFEFHQCKVHTLENPRIVVFIVPLEPLKPQAQGDLFGGAA